MQIYPRPDFVKKFGVTPAIFDIAKFCTTRIELQVVKAPDKAHVSHEFARVNIPGTDWWFVSLYIKWWISSDAKGDKMNGEVMKVIIYDSKEEFDFKMLEARQQSEAVN